MRLLPELRERVQSLFKRSDDDGKQLSLGLSSTKEAEGVGFSTTELDFLRKYPQIYSALSGGMPAWSGESVSLQTALQHSVVWACNRIVSESVGRIPAVVMQNQNGAKREATEKPMHSA